MIFFAGYATAILTTTKQINSTANIITTVNLKVFETETATVELTFMDWQNILPTEVKTKEIWIQNDADISLMISVSTKDWLPSSAQDSITFTYAEGKGWSGGAYPKLNPHQKAQMIFTLTATNDLTSGTFSFVIMISGSSV